MKSFEVAAIKPFMNALLTGGLFEEWQFRGGELSVECKIDFRPMAEKSYFESHEADYLLWPEIRDKICALIKGRTKPAYLRLVLALPPENLPQLPAENVDAFTLNLQYEKDMLILVSAVSDKSFSLDKEPARAWDAAVPEYFKACGYELREITD